MRSRPRQTGLARWLRLLVLIPFIVLAWVPSYNRVDPELAGIPFFYWYQLAWIIIGALLLAAVYEGEIKGREGRP